MLFRNLAATGASLFAVMLSAVSPVAGTSHQTPSQDYINGCKAACKIKHNLTPDSSWGQHPVSDYPGLNGFPFHFTSTFSVHALPDNVVNANSTPSFGQEGGKGWFNYGIDSVSEVICFNITIEGVQPPFKSPARTSTHIHQGLIGKAGPPRIAFPNPETQVHNRPDQLHSIGCFAGPFTTGIKDAQGKDTGEGFKLKQIEDDPKSFFTDVHTAAKPDGAVRGQLG